MRISAAVPILLCLLASSLAGQGSRLTIVPSFGHHIVGTLFHHRLEFTDPQMGEYRSTEQLELEDTRTIGALVSWQLPGSWLVYGEARHGGSGFRYRDEASSGQSSAEMEVSSRDASLSIFELGVGRKAALRTGWPELEGRLGAQLSRARVGDGYQECYANHPSMPGAGCTEAYWERRYDIPAVSGSRELAQHFASRFGLRVGASYALGRANTKNFWSDHPPEYDHLEAPKSRRVSTFRLSGGLSVGL